VQRKVVHIQARLGNTEEENGRIATKTEEELEKEYAETINVP